MAKLRTYLALAALALAASSPALAQSPFRVSINVDENGHGHFSNTAGFSQDLAGVMLPDPGPGAHVSALTYDLLNPPGLTVGDVLLADFAGGPLSDVIRFNLGAQGAGGSLVFYSALGGGSLADIGFPSAFYTNILNLVETTFADGSTGLIYTPVQGQPGFVAGAEGPVTYTILSDVVATPEPAEVVLMATGLLGLFAVVRRRSDPEM